MAPDPTRAISQTAPPARAPLPPFPAVVTSRRSRVVTSELDSHILELAIKTRKRVKQGDFIGRLDGQKVEAEIAALQQEMAGVRGDAGAAGASCRQARNTLRVQQRLLAKGYVSKNSVSEAEASASSACATASATGSRANAYKPRIEQLERQLAKAMLYAPIDGVITMLRTREGEAAPAGTPIARVYDDRDLVIRFAVDNEHVHRIKPGDRVELLIDGARRSLWASVDEITPEEAPLTFVTVLADLDDSRLEPDEVRVASEGRVRIVEPQGAKQ